MWRDAFVFELSKIFTWSFKKFLSIVRVQAGAAAVGVGGESIQLLSSFTLATLLKMLVGLARHNEMAIVVS